MAKECAFQFFGGKTDGEKNSSYSSEDGMASLVKICEICRNMTKYGTCSSSSVSLFNETLNKEFSSVLAGKPVILAKVLQSLGISVALNRCSVCKSKAPMSQLVNEMA